MQRGQRQKNSHSELAVEEKGSDRPSNPRAAAAAAADRDALTATCRPPRLAEVVSIVRITLLFRFAKRDK